MEEILAVSVGGSNTPTFLPTYLHGALSHSLQLLPSLQSPTKAMLPCAVLCCGSLCLNSCAWNDRLHAVCRCVLTQRQSMGGSK